VVAILVPSLVHLFHSSDLLVVACPSLSRLIQGAVEKVSRPTHQSDVYHGRARFTFGLSLP